MRAPPKMRRRGSTGRDVSRCQALGPGPRADLDPAGRGATLGAVLRADASTAHAPVRPRPRVSPRAVGVAAAVLVAAGTAFGLVFAGSPAVIAEGVQVAGVDVGGLRVQEARQLLERRAEDFARTPVTFVAGSRRWELTPAQLGVTVDWDAAIAAAQRQGEGFGPVRGYRRLQVRFFGADIAPPTVVSGAALAYAVATIAKEVEQRPREAELRLRGLEAYVVPARTGHTLDRAAAETVLVRALAGFARTPVGLPVRVTTPNVTAADLGPAQRQARVALSAPIRLDVGKTRWRVPRWRIAELLALPAGGSSALAVGGAAANAYFDRISALIAEKPRDADFRAHADGSVVVIPGAPGRELDRAATAKEILAAATARADRTAAVQVRDAAPSLTTAEAKAMGITRVMATYTTAYAGTADRIHNLQLAVSILDGALVAPGATFSFNERVGERTEERGFRKAPVIIENEYEDDFGGGVSQVATTVFNVAWEAGLKIAERAPHALYIGRYPLGRDATVNYPDLDLKFVNDTPKWILVRAVAVADGISVSLYGADTGRRVVSEAGPLLVKGPPPVKRVLDPTLEVGTSIVEEDGEPSRAVTVTRVVYDADGDVLYEETWNTAYRGEHKIVRVGTKPKPKPEPEKTPAKPQPPADDATTPTTPVTPTTPTTTTPTSTTPLPLP